jgi:hypothetical protein
LLIRYKKEILMIIKWIFGEFRSYIESFKYYRPLISVDETHLYGQYDGKLLIVVVFLFK